MLTNDDFLSSCQQFRILRIHAEFAGVTVVAEKAFR